VKAILRGLLPVAALAAAMIVAMRIAAAAADVDALPALAQPWLLGAAAPAMLATVACYALLWRTIVFSLDPARPPAVDSFAVFASSWLGRHVPTGAPYVAGKIVLGRRLGHGTAPLAASLVYENLIVVGVGCAAAALLLPWCLPGALPALAWLPIGVAGVIGVALLPSPLAHRLLARAAEFSPRAEVLRECRLPAGGAVRGAAVASFAACANGLAFAVALAALSDLGLRESIAAGVAFNFAGAVGVAAVPVPGGVGVREAVLVPLLHSIVPVEVALAAALIARVGFLCVDVAAGAGGAAWLAFRRPSLPETGAECAAARSELRAA
jgi:uncharacterized membrane protein YbhN (UPF0104 family)